MSCKMCLNKLILILIQSTSSWVHTDSPELSISSFLDSTLIDISLDETAVGSDASLLAIVLWTAKATPASLDPSVLPTQNKV